MLRLVWRRPGGIPAAWRPALSGAVAASRSAGRDGSPAAVVVAIPVVIGARRGLAGVPGRRPVQPAGSRASSSAAAGTEAGGQDEGGLARAYDARRLRAVDAVRRVQLEEAWEQLEEIEQAGWQPPLPERVDAAMRDGTAGGGGGGAAAEPRFAHVDVALELVDRGQMEEARGVLMRMGRVGAAGAAALASGVPHRSSWAQLPRRGTRGRRCSWLRR